MIELETSEALFRAFCESYAAVYGNQLRNDCERHDRCVYDHACPLFESCTPTEYSE